MSKNKKLDENTRASLHVLVYVFLPILCCVVFVLCTEHCSGTINEIKDELKDDIISIFQGNKGTYYLYTSGHLDKSDYFELKSGGEWIDSENVYGSYKIKNTNEITFYLGTGGIPAMTGIIGDGKLEIVISSYSSRIYYREGDEP